ncbi:unnamed protein product [Amoebophrya sp. A120]|nr:unnamed protein product [Amoebophrya sp. A120]|eukprot:GSA120T00017790001.1
MRQHSGPRQPSGRKRVVALIYRVAASRIADECSSTGLERGKNTKGTKTSYTDEATTNNDIHDVAVQALKETRTFLDRINVVLKNHLEVSSTTPGVIFPLVYSSHSVVDEGAAASLLRAVGSGCPSGNGTKSSSGPPPSCSEDEASVLNAVLEEEGGETSNDDGPLQTSPGVYAGTFAACTRALRRCAASSRGGSSSTAAAGGRLLSNYTSVSSSPPVRRGIFDPREEVSPFVRRRKLPPLQNVGSSSSSGPRKTAAQRNSKFSTSPVSPEERGASGTTGPRG